MSTMITVPFELTLDQLIDIVRQLDRPSRLKLIRAAEMPTKQSEVSDLARMLEEVTDENLHDEVETGEPVGVEVW